MMEVRAKKLVLAGVSGCGKTVVGREVARMLDADFLDADDFHTPEAVAMMSAGRALDDKDRAKWLVALGKAMAEHQGPVVLACSALRKAYRDRLRELCDGLVFVVLTADPDVIRNRMEARCGAGAHFMPPSLLDSQLATLEIADDVSVIRNQGSAKEVAAAALAEL